MEERVTEEVMAILTMLVAVQARPEYYMPTIQGIDEFVEGVRCTARFLGIEPDPALSQRVIKMKGWKVRGRLQRSFLRSHTSLSDREIAQELLAIEIETWRQAYDIWEEIEPPGPGSARVISRTELDALIAAQREFDDEDPHSEAGATDGSPS